MINFYGGPKSLGGMYDWDIITDILNAKYPNGVTLSDETVASKEFGVALSKVQSDMIAKSNEFDERIASLGDSASLKGLIEIYENPDRSTFDLTVHYTDDVNGLPITYTSTHPGAISDVDLNNKIAYFDNVQHPIAIQKAYDYKASNWPLFQLIKGSKNVMVISTKVGKQDSVGPEQVNYQWYVNKTNGSFGFQKDIIFTSQQAYSTTSTNADTKKYSMYFRANEMLTVDNNLATELGVDVSQYMGKPYARITRADTNEKLILIWGGGVYA